MKIRLILLVVAFLTPSLLAAQGLSRDVIYVGGMGGVATLSADANSVVTPTSAATSSYDPSNGGAASAFVGIRIFDYVGFQADYVWNRNDAVLVSSINNPSASSFYRLPETVTQNAFLGSALLYFRGPESRIQPYVSEGVGGVLIHSRHSNGGIVSGNPMLPPASSDHASIALRTSVGLDVRLRGSWYFRYSFGETIARNTFGNQLAPPEHRVAKNFQSLFGIYFRF